MCVWSKSIIELENIFMTIPFFDIFELNKNDLQFEFSKKQKCGTGSVLCSLSKFIKMKQYYSSCATSGLCLNIQFAWIVFEILFSDTFEPNCCRKTIRTIKFTLNLNIEWTTKNSHKKNNFNIQRIHWKCSPTNSRIWNTMR